MGHGAEDSRHEAVLDPVQEARGIKLNAWGQGRYHKPLLRLQVPQAKVKDERISNEKNHQGKHECVPHKSQH